MHMVTLINDDEDYKRQALMKIVKKASKDNADNPDYEISSWIDDDSDSLFLMADWGSSFEKGNQWYGVEGVLTLMKEVNEI